MRMMVLKILLNQTAHIAGQTITVSKELKLNDALQSNYPGWYLYLWAKDNNQRLPETYEKLLLKIGRQYILLAYVRDVLKDKWPEAEPILARTQMEGLYNKFSRQSEYGHLKEKINDES
jgi:hypothetical protein